MKDFDIELLRSHLRRKKDRNIVFFRETDSTNIRLLDDLSLGKAGKGDIYVANFQSAGRGRRGKSFSSKGGGIYMSFCAANSENALMTVTCGVAVADTLSSLGISPEIKWVNDVLIEEKKVCGILAQTKSGLDSAVIGVGINMHVSSIPNELSHIATALDAHNAEVPPREVIIADIVNRYEELSELCGEQIIARYKDYLTMLGENVVIVGTNEAARAVDIDLSGALAVRFPDGTVKHLSSGEISVRRADH